MSREYGRILLEEFEARSSTNKLSDHVLAALTRA